MGSWGSRCAGALRGGGCRDWAPHLGVRWPCPRGPGELFQGDRGWEGSRAPATSPTPAQARTVAAIAPSKPQGTGMLRPVSPCPLLGTGLVAQAGRGQEQPPAHACPLKPGIPGQAHLGQPWPPRPRAPEPLSCRVATKPPRGRKGKGEPVPPAGLFTPRGRSQAPQGAPLARAGEISPPPKR